MSTTTQSRGSYEKLSYIQKITRINRKLRTGDISRVATETQYSTTHVADVLAGNYFNDRILNRAYDLTRGRKANSKLL
jgi:hypothetical protein